MIRFQKFLAVLTVTTLLSPAVPSWSQTAATQQQQQTSNYERGIALYLQERYAEAIDAFKMHLKDNPHYLGEGKIDVGGVLKAMRDIGYEGFANLETVSPSKTVDADMKRNLTYLRRLLEA